MHPIEKYIEEYIEDFILILQVLYSIVISNSSDYIYVLQKFLSSNDMNVKAITVSLKTHIWGNNMGFVKKNNERLTNGDINTYLQQRISEPSNSTSEFFN